MICLSLLEEEAVDGELWGDVQRMSAPEVYSGTKGKRTMTAMLALEGG